MVVGDFVYYNYPHGGQQFGRIKSIQDDTHAFVCFHCGGDWANYKDYTGQRCELKSLTLSKNN